MATASVAALAMGAFGTTPLASADEVFPRPDSGVLTLIGRGYGHGRGMSQYGAMSAALEGETWQDIIDYYYPNTSRLAGFTGTIRVGVHSTTGMTARVAMESGLKATSAAGVTKVLASEVDGSAVVSWQVALPNDTTNTTGVALRARLADGRSVQQWSTTSGWWTFSSPDWTYSAMTSAGTKVATYLGTFRGVRAGSSIQPVVVSSMESYTRQVVPYENFGSWPVTAQASQAVAARSYGAWYLTHPVSANYDICDTTTCQVFGGLGAETANTKAGVQASAGTVIAISGKPIRAEFSSSNGGWTVASDVVFQIAQPDPWEGKLAPSAFTWRASVSAATIQSKWPEIGTFTRLVITSRDGHGWWGGRVLGVRIEGTSGNVTRTGDQFRATFGLRSNYLTVVDSPAALFRDQSGDGRPDFLSRASDGRLLSTRSTSATTFATPVKVGTSWGAYKHVFSAGLFGSDRYADVMTVDSTGTLRYHTSYGSWFGASAVLGTGFGAYNAFVTLDDFAGTGAPSILARRSSDGAVVRFNGNGTGGLVSTTPTVITPAGWGGNTYNKWFGAGDITGDGHSDLVVRASNGYIWAWKGNGAGGFSGSVRLATGWSAFWSLTSPGDVNNDGLSDVVARYSDGRTRLFSVRTSTGWATSIGLATAQVGQRLLS